MEWRHLTEVLNRYGEKLSSEYASLVPEATGALADNDFILDINGREMVVSLRLKDYWWYVENGRKAGKFPPMDKIEKWIRAKPILPRERNGRIPTEKQLAFLIGRKIANEGTEGTKPFTRANNEVWGQMRESIIAAIREDINEEMKYLFVAYD